MPNGDRQDKMDSFNTRAVCAVGRKDNGGVAEHSMTDDSLLRVAVSPFDLSLDRLVGKVSGGDFATVYTDADSITVSSLPVSHPTLIGDDVVAVAQIDSLGLLIKIWDRHYAMEVTAGVLTVTNATFEATDTFVVYTNVRHV